MSVTRRQALVGGVSAAVAASVALPAIAAPVPAVERGRFRVPLPQPAVTAQSPFLGVQSGPTVHTLRIRYPQKSQPVLPEAIAAAYAVGTPLRAAPGSHLRVQILKETPQVPVRDVAEAEDRFIATLLADPGKTFRPADVTGRFEKDAVALHAFYGRPIDPGFVALPILFNRAANLIAARNRRGPGNVVLMNDRSFDWLIQGVLAGLANGLGRSLEGKDRYGETVGRWTVRGMLNETFTIYSGPMPDKAILVLFKGMGEVDAGAFYSEHAGQGFLTMLENTATSLGNCWDYAQVIRVEL